MGLFQSKKKDQRERDSPAAPEGSKGSTSSSKPSSTPTPALGPPTDEYKVLVLGELGVGKTNILLRFCENLYIEEDPSHTKPPPESYLGNNIDRKSKVMQVGNEVIKMTVIDTMGNEKFRAVSSSVYSQLDGVLIVFGYDNKDTLLKCQSTWLRETQKILVGNKSDIPALQRQAETSKAQALARDCDNIPFMETSAKTNTNIDPVFQEMAKLIKAVKDRKKGVGLS